MSTFTPAIAHGHAVTLVAAALGSGAIKLVGPSYSDENNTAAIKNDAEYLNSLINSLAKNLTLPGGR